MEFPSPMNPNRKPDEKIETIEVDERKGLVTVNGQAVALTPTEFRLLAALVARRGRALSRKELVQIVMSDAIVQERTIDVHMTSLRRKLGAAARQIKAVRGIGYQFETSPGD
jgi:DNA-binding response OmpR family regulator